MNGMVSDLFVEILFRHEKFYKNNMNVKHFIALLFTCFVSNLFEQDIINLYAGDGTSAFGGDGGTALTAQLRLHSDCHKRRTCKFGMEFIF